MLKTVRVKLLPTPDQKSILLASQQCSVCGYTDKKNRKTRNSFSCLSCNHAEPADINAAKNIARRAAANQHMVAQASSATSYTHLDDASSCKPPVLTGGS